MRSAFVSRALIAALVLRSVVVATAQTPTYVLREEFRIGDVLDGPAALSEVRSLALARDGTIIVSQPQEGRLRLFDRNGRYLRSIGRSGGGPGEFRRLGPVNVRGDTLHVIDHDLQRITRFTLDGRLIDVITVSGPSRAGFRPAGPTAVLSDGTIIAQSTIPAAVLTADGTGAVPIFRLRRDGTLVDTLPSQRWGSALLSVRHANGATHLQRPGIARSLLATAPDGSWFVQLHQPEPAGRLGQLLLTRYAATGDEVYRRSISYAPRPIPRQHANTILEGRAAVLRPRIPAAELEAALRQLLPPYQATATQLVAGYDETTWVRREEFVAGNPEWHVFAPNGALRAVVQEPTRTRFLRASMTAVWAVVLDELDVPYVVRFRLVPREP